MWPASGRSPDGSRRLAGLGRTAPRAVRPRACRAACLRWSSSLLGQEHAAQAAAHDLDEEAAGGPVVGAHGRRIVADGDGGDPRGATLLEGAGGRDHVVDPRSEEHTSELQSLMRTTYAVFCLKKKT